MRSFGLAWCQTAHRVSKRTRAAVRTWRCRAASPAAQCRNQISRSDFVCGIAPCVRNGRMRGGVQDIDVLSNIARRSFYTSQLEIDIWVIGAGMTSGTVAERHSPGYSAAARLLHRLDISRTPSLVKPRLKRAVETQEGVPALAGDGLHPIVFLARRSLRSEIDIH